MYLWVFFPNGRCYAAEFHDPSLPEWAASPLPFVFIAGSIGLP